jgi:hypothetical protein
MKKLRLNLDDIHVESFDVRSRPRGEGTVHGRDDTFPTDEAVGTCAPFTCGEISCVDYGCGNTEEPSCDLNPCGESVSCTTQMCGESHWENQCTAGGRGGELCGSFVC